MNNIHCYLCLCRFHQHISELLASRSWQICKMFVALREFQRVERVVLESCSMDWESETLLGLDVTL